jgi:DNA-binding MarR family transcriptional regulator
MIMDGLDSVIHQPVRLRIMAALTELGPKDNVDFAYLKKRLNLTDGNLGSHLQTLETAGYLRVEKTFVDRRPRTYVSATAAGRFAFDRHVAALRAILHS